MNTIKFMIACIQLGWRSGWNGWSPERERIHFNRICRRYGIH